ncbi:MAG: phosphotransferase family protein [Oscillospiraceae bacterium]
MNFDRIIAVRNDKTVYRDGDRCVKVFGSGYTCAEVLNEAHNQALALEAGLRVPKVLEVTKFDGKWALVSEYIKGTSLEELMRRSPEKRDGYMQLFVDLQLAMHAKTCPEMPKLRDKMNRRICGTDLTATLRFSLHAMLDDMPKHGKVCHGDFCPENIIISEDGEPYIIDWSHATQGNASADVARTYLLFWLNGDINGAEFYLNTFCKKSDTAKQYVQKWMPIVAASQSVKGKKEERELLLGWVNVVDYE